MNYERGQKLIKWILILPIAGLIITSFLFLQTFMNHQQESYEDELNYSKREIIRKNKLIAKSKVEEIADFIRLSTIELKNEAKEESKEMTNFAYNIIKNVYETNKHLPKDNILKLISLKLEEMRFFKHLNGYFYIMSMQGHMIMHPIDASLIGKDLINLKDVKGKEFLKDGIKMLKNKGECSIDYFWKRTNSTKIAKKYTYMKKFAPLDLFVATGRYEDSILEDIKSRVQNVLINTRYGKKGYIFAYDGEGTTISHIKKDFIGMNRWDEVVNGERLVRELIRGSKVNEEGFFKSYIARYDPITKKESYKTSYIKYLPEFNWIIGTGVYGNEVEKELEEKKKYITKKFDEILSKLLFGFLVIVTIVFLSTFAIFTKLRKILKSYNDALVDHTLETLEQKEDLIFQLRHDILTSLPNRILLTERLNESIIRAKRNKTKVAILFIDIDDFKKINDNYGHDVGDRILKEFANCLKSSLRESDLASRLSGDEFVILIENCKDKEDVSVIVEKIYAKFMKPILINDIQYYIKTSIGVSFYPDNGNDFETLIKSADTAMYSSKNNGKNKFTICE